MFIYTRGLSENFPAKNFLQHFVCFFLEPDNQSNPTFFKKPFLAILNIRSGFRNDLNIWSFSCSDLYIDKHS